MEFYFQFHLLFFKFRYDLLLRNFGILIKPSVFQETNSFVNKITYIKIKISFSKTEAT